jgi:4-hydroxybenzoyl-CoA thioesterase
LFFDNGHAHVHQHADSRLLLHGVLGGSGERLDAQVSFDLPNEQLTVPASAIKVGNGECEEQEVVGQKNQRQIFLGDEGMDATQWFPDCDPSGILFYPHYLEMLNALVEDWFAEELGFSFQEILKSNLGIPTVHLNADFIAPGRLGDELSVTLAVTRFESSGLTVEVVFSDPAGDVRVRSDAVLGLTDSR